MGRTFRFNAGWEATHPAFFFSEEAVILVQQVFLQFALDFIVAIRPAQVKSTGPLDPSAELRRRRCAQRRIRS